MPVTALGTTVGFLSYFWWDIYPYLVRPFLGAVTAIFITVFLGAMWWLVADNDDE